MMNVSRNFRAAKIAALLVAALAMGACAKSPASEDVGALANASAATPGSQQDFVVNVGDRVFFNSDSSELTPQSIATLDKQAQWLRSYAAVHLHGRGPCRRARHARVQYRARRQAGAGGARLSGLARRAGASHAHDLLRQGAAGRGLRRHIVLVAESPLGDGAQRQLLKIEEIKWGKGTTGASRRRLCFVATPCGTCVRQFPQLSRFRLMGDRSKVTIRTQDFPCCGAQALQPVTAYQQGSTANHAYDHQLADRLLTQCCSRVALTAAAICWQAPPEPSARPPAISSPGFLDGLFDRGGDAAPARRDRLAQSSASELSVRIDRLEAQIRQMTGVIEQLQYRNQQLAEQLRRMQEDPGALQSSAQPRPVGPTMALRAARRPLRPASPGSRPAPASPGPARRRVRSRRRIPTAPGAPRTLGALPGGAGRAESAARPGGGGGAADRAPRAAGRPASRSIFPP